MKQLTYDGLKTEKTLRLFHNDKFYTCEMITNGKKVLKRNMSEGNIIPTNQLEFKVLETLIKFQYAIEYNINNKDSIYIKSWCYVPYNFIDSFDKDSYYSIYANMEYYLSNFLKNKCEYIKKYK